MIMLCRPMWPFLLVYGSHDMRHTGFPQVDGGQRDPREMGRHKNKLVLIYVMYKSVLINSYGLL